MRFWGATLMVLGIAACDSNPTPHPAQDATIGGNLQDTASPPEPAEPDDNDNGVGDCTEVQQFWDGEACRGEVDPSLDAGDASHGGETVDGEVSEDVDDATAPDQEVTGD